MRFLSSAAMALALLLSAYPAWAIAVAGQPYRIGPGARVAADVSVNGRGPFTFLLDTAASRSMMFEHVRAQLGLQPVGDRLLTVYGMQNAGTAVPVGVDELRLSGEAIRGLTMGVLPDEPDSSDGLLGIDVLSSYLVVLDRAGWRLKLLAPDGGDRSGFAGWPSLSLTPRPIRDTTVSFWSLRAQVGGVEVTALFDMGSGMTIVNWSAAERLGLKRTSFPRDGVPQRLRDALGTVEPVGLVKDATIWLGGRVFRNQIVLVANVKVFKYLNMDDKPAAIIGSGLLKDNSLAIDFAGQRLYLGPAVKD